MLERTKEQEKKPAVIRTKRMQSLRDSPSPPPRDRKSQIVADANNRDRCKLKQELDLLKRQQDSFKQEQGLFQTEHDKFKRERQKLNQEQDLLKRQQDSFKQEQDLFQIEQDKVKREKHKLERDRDLLKEEVDKLQTQKRQLVAALRQVQCIIHPILTEDTITDEEGAHGMLE